VDGVPAVDRQAPVAGEDRGPVGLAVLTCLRCQSSSRSPGLILEMRVAQLPSGPRVPPQVPKGATLYCAKLQVWAMYSDAIHTESPLTAAAP